MHVQRAELGRLRLHEGPCRECGRSPRAPSWIAPTGRAARELDERPAATLDEDPASDAKHVEDRG